MTNDNAIVPGSISAIARSTNRSIALAIMDCEIIILVDTSASMASHDSRGGLSRYAVACDELSKLQESHPGKILVVSFSDTAIVCLNGIPQFMNAGTMVSHALQYIKSYDDIPGMQIVLISDGEPMDEVEALRMAHLFKNPISTVYVGPENQPEGRDFLRRLAQATGGSTVTADRAKELVKAIEVLLLKG